MSRIRIIIYICVIIIISLGAGHIRNTRMLITDDYEDFNTMYLQSEDTHTLKIDSDNIMNKTQGEKCDNDSQCISNLCIKDVANILTCSD